jgi:hypothetical protein
LLMCSVTFIGRWSMVVGLWSLVGGRWSLVDGRWSLDGADFPLAFCVMIDKSI